ncbi:MAG TPA: sugar phosphate isomerase/epimerase [Clostridiaceae bacterium]|nr:sugar phosphate isomerase/epimerase [Clostridiaceae bacterium]
MKLINSVCTNLYFPKSRKNIDEFRRMAYFLAEKGIECIEFYHDGDSRDKIGSVLLDTGLSSVYIAVIPSKESRLDLCHESEEGRTAAVKLFKSCIDEAQHNGIPEIMMNSGRIGNNVEKGLDSLAKSIEELYDYVQQKNYSLCFLMEPCDSIMEAFHLIGPYARTLEFMKRMDNAGLPIKLTLDTAHTVEEGENFLEALKAVKPYCNHIHFANCFIKDRKNPLYGDKHLGYEYPDTEWMIPDLSNLFISLEGLYGHDEDLRIGLEALCRQEDPYEYFNSVWESLTFLHKNLKEENSYDIR